MAPADRPDISKMGKKQMNLAMFLQTPTDIENQLPQGHSFLVVGFVVAAVLMIVGSRLLKGNRQ